MPTLAARLTGLQHTITQSRKHPLACTGDAQLIAVSKQQPDALIDAALQAGQRVFGENRVQEAQQRWAQRRLLYPDLELHLIGPLQSNKAAEAVALFDVIHTIDRPKIAHAVDHAIREQQKPVRCFIQVNTGEEPQKAGVLPDALDDFVALCRTETQLEIVGLMCIPPVGAPPALHFLLLRQIAACYQFSGLSMGMSDDYDTALRCGATHVRIGSRLFGSRSG